MNDDDNAIPYHPERIRCQAVRRYSFGFEVELHLLQGKRRVIKAIEWEEIASGACYPDTPIRLGRTESQALMDSLWCCGIRPSEGTGSAGSLKATENHLKDMRLIALTKLGIKE